ncbi:hypothetical protein Pen01_62460 [Phytomonospora endophytica]|nr:hypothetical protein Pen01_62460 [Phytomonospora endophytica]
MLDGFLDWQRASLLLKCTGLTGRRLAEKACPPSDLSLLGLVRHVTDVERTWFVRRFGGRECPSVYWREEHPSAAFDEADPAHAEAELARLSAEQDSAREAVRGLSLDAVFVSDTWGEMSLRWCYSHMIAEYARHCGHADLLRQRIDGTTGA